MRTQISGFLLLLALIANSAWAQSSLAMRETGRFTPVQSAVLEEGEQHPAQAQLNERRARDFELPDVGNYPQSGTDFSAPDNSRKHGRLSPEERRALRRQINEVGHDLYTPKR